MTRLIIEAPGPLALVQGGPRVGLRHLGVPWAGAADALSLALANRLVGNDSRTPGIEATFGGLRVRAEVPVSVAVTGAPAPLTINDRPGACHETLTLAPGQTLTLGTPPVGARAYLAVSGGFALPDVLGSASTYTPARLGGLNGLALRAGDALPLAAPRLAPPEKTPEILRPPITPSAILRTVPSAEFGALTPDAARALFERPFRVSTRSDRWGLRLEGPPLSVRTSSLPSGMVLPGTIQLPAGGEPILLGPDAQTTGGYPRIASVAVCDLHLAGQLRPGDTVRLARRDPAEATRTLRAKLRRWAAWCGTDWAR